MHPRLFAVLLMAPLVLRAQDTTAAKNSLLGADRAASVNSAALAAALSPDAVVMSPGQRVLRGPADSAQLLQAFAAAPSGRTAWTPVHAVVSGDGMFGCTTGVLHLAARDSTQPRTGRYASCWRKSASGGWRLIVHGRADAPPQVASLPDSIPQAPGSTGVRAPRDAFPARAMTAADRAFAKFSTDSGGPAGAFARWIAPDGMMLGTRPVPPRGPEQARKAFAGFPATGRFEWEPIEPLTRVSRDGGLGYTVGEARIAASPTDVSYSKYLTIWRRDADGNYRFIFDIGSDRPAP